MGWARAERGYDIGHAARPFEIEGDDAGVGVGTAHEGDVQHVGQAQVADVAALSLQQARVFAPAQARRAWRYSYVGA